MQITCSKCKKVYTVNPNKIPSGITSTKCKNCGNSISLRLGAPKAPARPAPTVMHITCQYCNRKYRVDPKSIPDGITSTKCKACSHTISLTPKGTEPPAPEPAKTGQQNSGNLEIVCVYCSQKYSINANKIPPGVTSIKCKACGHTLSLKPPAENPALKSDSNQKIIPLKQQSKGSTGKQPIPDIPILQNMGRPTTPIFRKSWILAAAAGIIIMVLAGNLLKTNWHQVTGNRFGLNRVNGKKPAIHKKEPQTRSLVPAEPLIAARLNVPLLLEAIDQNLPEEKKDLKYKMTTGMFKSFGFGKIQVYLYPDPEYTFLPVILAASKDGKSLETRLKSQNNFIQFLERGSDGYYRINQKALPEDKRNNFPVDRYRIKFVDNSAIFAPEHLVQVLKEGERFFHKTQVAQMIDFIAKPRDLAVLSVRVPETFATNWQEKIRNNPALKQNPQAAMFAAMGERAIAQLSGSLKGTESLAVAFRLNSANGRVLSYAQQFGKNVDAKKIAEQLKSGKHGDLKIDGIALKLLALLSNPRYQRQIGHKNNRLTLELSWEKQHDKAFLTSLSEATLGQIFRPSESRVKTQYSKKPVPSNPRL